MMIECKKCGASPYAVSVYENASDSDKKTAIAEYWNRRAENE